MDTHQDDVQTDSSNLKIGAETSHGPEGMRGCCRSLVRQNCVATGVVAAKTLNEVSFPAALSSVEPRWRLSSGDGRLKLSES